MRENREVEDGMGFSGLAPSNAERSHRTSRHDVKDTRRKQALLRARAYIEMDATNQKYPLAIEVLAEIDAALKE